MEPKREAGVLFFEGGRVDARSDDLVTEEPLEIRLRAAGPTSGEAALAMQGSPSEPKRHQSLAITMRTPGADAELAAGFLYAEGVIRGANEIAAIAHCEDVGVDRARRFNIVNVDLTATTLPALDGLQRHFHATSACGVCGKASLDALRFNAPAKVAPGPVVDARILTGLPGKLSSGQGLFASTGGLHAAALFDPDGALLAVREDIGRHNAVDKLVGWALLERRLPLTDRLLMVSGRTSFEILQKAVMAGVPIVCAVSAPSTLAVSVAREFGVTLVGFLRGERFNVYTGAERIKSATLAGRT